MADVAVSAPARRAHPATQVAAGLVVQDDHAELRYDGTFFRASQRRLLRNDGPEPVTRYLMRISVDRYPGQPERSNKTRGFTDELAEATA